jgi:hypothetical protein
MDGLATGANDEVTSEVKQEETNSNPPVSAVEEKIEAVFALHCELLNCSSKTLIFMDAGST